VVVHRCKRDTLQLRIVWQGGETTTQKIPIPVGSFAELSGSKEMEQKVQAKPTLFSLSKEAAKDNRMRRLPSI